MDIMLDELIKNIEAIIAGVPLDWGGIPESNKRTVLLCALHCCLNGPVGVNKRTTFPVVGEAQINALVKVSNSSWRGFCGSVAAALVDKNVRVDCNSMRILKTFWPLADWPKDIKRTIL